MTPKEWKFFESVIEHVGRKAYEAGFKDAKEKATERADKWVLSRDDKLVLKAALERHLRGT